MGLVPMYAIALYLNYQDAMYRSHSLAANLPACGASLIGTTQEYKVYVCDRWFVSCWPAAL